MGFFGCRELDDFDFFVFWFLELYSLAVRKMFCVSLADRKRHVFIKKIVAECMFFSIIETLVISWW